VVPLSQLGLVRRLAGRTAGVAIRFRGRFQGKPITPLETLYSTWRACSAAGAIDILESARHGDLPRWRHALETLPDIAADGVSFGATVTARSARATDRHRAQIREALRGLVPWRKGPYQLFGVDIDSEWRSDLKWARVAPHVDLAGARILDVGCGNGYYGWRMLDGGARSVTGIDPSLLATLQHAAISYYVNRGQIGNTVLPMRVEDFGSREPFDVIFSMGVVYHRRDPAGHVAHLASFAHRETTLVIESLVVDEGPLEPADRYARMGNVQLIPDVPTLRSWLEAAGFGAIRLVDVSATTTEEQRRTEWMPFESLAAALDPGNPAITVEGYPAPKRAVMIARQH